MFTYFFNKGRFYGIIFKNFYVDKIVEKYKIWGKTESKNTNLPVFLSANIKLEDLLILFDSLMYKIFAYFSQFFSYFKKGDFFYNFCFGQILFFSNTIFVVTNTN